jgi:formate-dependent phosphoribosylglycinamide formyltransferase (GAR transformylase)
LVAHLHFLPPHKSTLKNAKELPSQRTTTDKMDRQQHDRKNNEHLTAPTRNWRFSASYDSFPAKAGQVVVNQTFVLSMNICGKNRQLLVAAKRYAVF